MASDTIAAGSAPRAAKAKRAPAKTRSIGRPAAQRRIGKSFLIDKTVELLREVPPEKLSLSMAARHAGVHLTLFKYYFTDRTRLLVDVARTLAVSLGDGVAAIETGDLPAPERLRIRINTMVDFFFLNPFYHRLMMEIIADESDPLAAELIRVWVTKTLDIYRDIIDAGVAEGSLRPIDPYLTFVACMGLCEQYQHAARFVEQTEGGKRSRDETSARYKAFVYDLMLNGIGTS
jgi:AcrR family transcriptional regulator